MWMLTTPTPWTRRVVFPQIESTNMVGGGCENSMWALKSSLDGNGSSSNRVEQSGADVAWCILLVRRHEILNSRPTWVRRQSNNMPSHHPTALTKYHRFELETVVAQEWFQVIACVDTSFRPHGCRGS